MLTTRAYVGLRSIKRSLRPLYDLLLYVRSFATFFGAIPPVPDSHFTSQCRLETLPKRKQVLDHSTVVVDGSQVSRWMNFSKNQFLWTGSLQ